MASRLLSLALVIALSGTLFLKAWPSPPSTAAPGGWTSLPPLPSIRSFAAAAATTRGVFVAGGARDGTILSEFLRFNPTTNTWTEMAPMNTPRRGLGLVAIDQETLLAIGGSNSTDMALKTVEMFDVNTGTWSYRASMGAPRNSFAACADSHGRVFVIGGRTGAGAGLNNKIERYVFDTDEWTYMADMPAILVDIAVVCHPDEMIYVFGGETHANLFSSVIYRYDIAGNSWSVFGSMPTGRIAHSATLIDNDSVLIMGGIVGYGHAYPPPPNTIQLAPSDDALEFSLSTGEWRRRGAMTSRRFDFASAVLGDFTYVAGGFSGVDTLVSFERFNHSAQNHPVYVPYVAMRGVPTPTPTPTPTATPMPTATITPVLP